MANATGWNPKNGGTGTGEKTQPYAPSPNPGMGAIPKGGPRQVPGQPDLKANGRPTAGGRKNG